MKYRYKIHFYLPGQVDQDLVSDYMVGLLQLEGVDGGFPFFSTDGTESKYNFRLLFKTPEKRDRFWEMNELERIPGVNTPDLNFFNREYMKTRQKPDPSREVNPPPSA